jgi:hypothetical protein
VWQLVTKEKSLVLLPGAERTVLLGQPAATSDELAARLAAVGEVLKALQVPSTPGVSGHGVVRLGAWLRARLGDDEFAAVEGALAQLEMVGEFRNGLLHQASRVPLPEACASLGVRWPIIDPAEAWSGVQARCVEALDTVREGVRTLA